MGAGDRPKGYWAHIALIAFLPLLVTAFNVDTKNAVIHSAGSGRFGYSLDFYHEQKGVPVLIVGAPESQSGNPALKGIRTPGAVFSCPVNKPGCREVHIDKNQGNERRLNGSHLAEIEDKAFQRFGATVRSNRKHDKLMMCAPNYKYFFSRFEVIEPIGTCFYAEDGFTKTQEFPTCKQEPARHGRHRLGYGQCGFSVALPDKMKRGDERAFVAGPGVWYWQGAIFSQSLRNSTDKPNTEIGPAFLDHDMMGYSTATGDFDGDGIDDVVSGVPRGNELMGKLVLWTPGLHHLMNLTDSTSPQTGQYCGHSVIVTDLNKDGRDDIVMGCPFFTDYVSVMDAKTQERKPQYDVGKVIVFLQTAVGVFEKQVAIVGDDQWGRFGFSLAAAGDLNQDGYNDFIVGAPYAGTERRGAVYVIHGSKDGVRVKPTQKIEAHKVRQGISTFGYSLAGNLDVDSNGIPDLAVGGWKSGHATILLTKPVVTVTGQTDSDGVTLNMEEKNCDVGDKKMGLQTCRTINTCLKYEGRGETPNDLEFVLRTSLDDHSPEPRAYFIGKEVKADREVTIPADSKTKDHPNIIERRIRLEKGRQKCFKQRFFASDSMRDKLTPIHWSVNYTYQESPTGKLRGGQLEPAIDTTVPLAFENKLNIANNCGKDGICVPDLNVHAVADRAKFLLGTTDNTMLINVSVFNRGEDAYETKLFFDVPEGFEYSGVEASKDEKQTAPSCSPTSAQPDEDGKWVFACELGNPLPQGKSVSTTVRITANQDKPPLKPITIRAHVNSTNNEEESTSVDNNVEFTVPVDFKNQLTLVGRPEPEQVDFSIRNQTNDELFDDNQLGPVVSHMYQVSNRGPSAIDSVTLDIFWPSFSTEGNHLLYILKEPVLNDATKGRCRVKQAQNVNPLNLRITDEHVPTQPPVKEEDYAEHDDEREEDDDDAKVEAQPVRVQSPAGDQQTSRVQSPSVSHGQSTPSRNTQVYEQDSFQDNAPTQQTVSGTQWTYEADTTQETKWTYDAKPTQKVEWEYIPDTDGEVEYDDDEYEDDRENSRVKRQAGGAQNKRRKGPQKPAKETKTEGTAGQPPRDRARFSDLREAVRLSKDSSGAVDYTGIVSRATVDCNQLRCTHIECDIFNLREGEFVLVEVFARVFTRTLVDERTPSGEVSSLGIARVGNTKFNWPHKPTLVTAVTTDLNAVDEEGSGAGVPWWLYLLAVLIGLVILALIILLLWRCGFFKRNRPHAEQAERRANDDTTGGQYADTKTRYAPQSDYNPDYHGQRL
ncbi:unnamed protein product, partial [Mesorhabditis belari]|uniref:Integrin alpha-2 domain-containing protein n=1 Tax=Mesorhabditis belari TaxID=2138241 RepID=A0AAF3EBF0_9BILA